jgi:SAM-dependent methyltransferase
MPHDLDVQILPVGIVALAAVMTINPIQWVMTVIAVHTLAFFVVALMCHGELARRRPTPAYLTDFYMAISTGGMIGGIAVGLVSPQIFNWVAEYPLLIVLAILCLPQSGEQDRPVYRYALLAGLGALALGLIALKATGTTLHTSAISIANALLLALTVFFWRSRLSLAAIVAVLFAANYFWFDYTSSQYQARNFFGVLNVGETYDGRFRLLWHGTIAQGAERVRDNDGKPVSGRPELISEFFPGAGIAQVFDAVQARADGPIDYAVIGLGTGALTCRARPGDRAIYYEIDPDVIRIAQNPKLFRFISECGPNTPVIQGDARLSLADAPDGSYDLIFVDAFLGAAIPVHLLTREAMALYLRKLKPHGLVALHISNRNLELAPVIAGIAAANGAIARIYDGGDVEDEPSENKWVPKVAAVAREDADFGALAGSEYWPILAPSAGKRVWSDDYSNILDALLTNLRER